MEPFKIWIIGYVISTLIILMYKTDKKKVDLEWIIIYLGISILILLSFIGINIK